MINQVIGANKTSTWRRKKLKYYARKIQITFQPYLNVLPVFYYDVGYKVI